MNALAHTCDQPSCEFCYACEYPEAAESPPPLVADLLRVLSEIEYDTTCPFARQKAKAALEAAGAYK